MINRSLKTVIKRMVLTLRKSKLHFIGVYPFIMEKKTTIKLKQQKVPTYCLYVSTEDGKYRDTIVVNALEYKRYKKGQVIHCAVIKHSSGAYIVSLHTNKEEAIRKLVKKAQLDLLFIFVAISLFLSTLFFFIINWLH